MDQHSEVPFSTVLFKAKELGFTEPDPREDLSGFDFARKMVILAREVGLDLSMDDVLIETLVPEQLRTVSVSQFLEDISQYDSVMSEQRTAALENNQILRVFGTVNVQDNAVKIEMGR